MTRHPSANELIALRFALDERGRMVGTNEPPPRGRAPALTVVRAGSSIAWAVRADVDDERASRVASLVAAGRDAAELAAELGGVVDGGPAFLFGASPPAAADSLVVAIDRLAALAVHFRGWRADELPERQPILGICDGGAVVSVCFCARRSATAAEAGVETAAGNRGRGLAARVTAAWASAVRASGRTPIYSTSWSNAASLAVARKLGLVQFATETNIG